jgi:hypothetical protein
MAECSHSLAQMDRGKGNVIAPFKEQVSIILFLHEAELLAFRPMLS